MSYYNKTMILLRACPDNNNLDLQYNSEYQQWGFSLSLQTAIFAQSCFCVEFCKAIFRHLPYLVEMRSRKKHKVFRISVIRRPPVNNFIRAPCCAHSENFKSLWRGLMFQMHLRKPYFFSSTDSVQPLTRQRRKRQLQQHQVSWFTMLHQHTCVSLSFSARKNRNSLKVWGFFW